MLLSDSLLVLHTFFFAIQTIIDIFVVFHVYHIRFFMHRRRVSQKGGGFVCHSAWIPSPINNLCRSTDESPQCTVSG